MTKRTSAFVLMELLIVIAIIGILAGMLLPVLAHARERARRASCLANLSQLGIAIRLYADEHDGQLPWSGGGDNADCLLHLYSNYMMEPSTFVCPSDAGISAWELQDWFAEQQKSGETLVLGPGTRQEPVTYDQDGVPLEDQQLTTAWDGELSLRCSYDYLGAYTTAPLRTPHPSRPFPKTPIMWDNYSIQVHDDEADRWYSGRRFNHVPGGSNVLWMDGSVHFMKSEEFAGPVVPAIPPGVEYTAPESSQ